MFIFPALTEYVEKEIIMQYCYFIQHMTLKIYGIRHLNNVHTKHQGMKRIFELITPSGKAYNLFVFMNGYEYWLERVQLTEEVKRVSQNKEGPYTYELRMWPDDKKNPYAEYGFTD